VGIEEKPLHIAPLLHQRAESKRTTGQEARQTERLAHCAMEGREPQEQLQFRPSVELIQAENKSELSKW